MSWTCIPQNHRLARLRRLPLWLAAWLLLAQLGVMAMPPSPTLAAPTADDKAEIIYLDPNGFIRVLDPDGPVGQPRVEWVSPTGGWSHVALADVNGDGDMEIVAIGDIGGSVKFTIFDPVVASGGSRPDRIINGIPWDILYETTFPGAPLWITGGNYDPGIQADEVLIGYTDPSLRRFVRVYNAASLGPNNRPTGRDMKIHLQKDYDIRWTFGASGDLLNNGRDEVVFVLNDGSNNSRLDVFIPYEDMRVMTGTNSNSGNFRSVAIGQVIPGGKQELVLGRTGRNPTSHTLFVYVLDNNNSLNAPLDDKNTNRFAFSPAPQNVFLADISGNGDKEVFFIRTGNNLTARLIMRDEWGDDRTQHPTIELRLDDDSGYRVGAGGDVLGDGKDEVIIMRDNNIRIYTTPGNNVNNQLNFAVNSNSQTILVGDLDRNGFVSGPSFVVNPTRITAGVPIGTISDPIILRVTNGTTNDGINFSLALGAPWIFATPNPAVVPPNGGAAEVQIRLSATGLPQGEHRATITLNSGDNVSNKPFDIEVVLTVLPADLRAQPAALTLMHEPCSAPLAPTQRTINIVGTNALNYRAVVIAPPQAAAAGLDTTDAEAGITGATLDEQGNVVLYLASGATRTIAVSGVDTAAPAAKSWPIDPDVPWITQVSSDRTAVPATITVTADPTSLGAGFQTRNALLVLVADARAGEPPENVRIVPLSIICVNSRTALPNLWR